MLKQRIISAIILIPIVIWSILDLPWFGFAVITAAILALCAWEWGNLMPFSKRKDLQFAYIISLLILFVVAFHLPWFLLLGVGTLWWLVATAIVIFYPRGANIWGKGLSYRVLMGALTFIPCWLGFQVIHLRQNGPGLLLFIVVVVWCADTGAYFAGKRWGKHKLIPQVSPGKTVEGLIGGILASCIIAGLGIWLLSFSHIIQNKIYLFFLTFISILFSIVGDLLESALKRQAGVKDSGQLLPGHGGILDRLDSMLAAITVFAFGLIIILH